MGVPKGDRSVTYRLTDILAGEKLIAEVDGFRSSRRLIMQMALKGMAPQLVRITHAAHPEKTWVFSAESIPESE